MADARLTRLVDHLKPGYLDETDEQIIARLEALPLVAEPDATFRAELRSRLLTMAPDLMAEPEFEADEIDEAAGRYAEPAQIGWQRHYPALRKPLLVAASAAAVLVVLLGMSVWLSGNALPGQALYGLKRASENVQLSVTHGDAAKGRKYLDFASIRISEAAKLAGAPASSAGSGKAMADTVSAHAQQLVISTLAAGNADVRSGSRLITSAAVADKDPTELAPLKQFAATQSGKLDALIQTLPKGTAAKSAAKNASNLVAAVAQRATELSVSVGCTCINPDHTDNLGPTPCTACPPAKRHTKPPSGTQGSQSAPYVTPGGSGSGSPASSSRGPLPPTEPGGGGGGGPSSSPSPTPPTPSTTPTSAPSSAPSSDPTSDPSTSDSSSADGGTGAQSADPSDLHDLLDQLL